MRLVLICLGGALGTGLRYLVTGVAARWFGPAFPYGTLAVNVVGSLIMGLVAGYFAFAGGAGQHWRLFLATGILGGFTTFSAFSLDAVLLWERSEFGLAATYVVASVALSILGLVAGLTLVRHLT